METKFYTEMLKEQKKLRSRLARKSQRVGELLYEIDRLQGKANLLVVYCTIVLLSLIGSIILNFYFIFK